MEPNIEFESYLTKSELASFLKNLIGQIEKGDEIRIVSEDQEINLKFTEPIKIKAELEDKKLKVKIEFKQHSKLTV